MNQIKILANNIEFEVLIEGESDKLILLLHGFPDDAKSYTHLMQNLSAAGYMCAAPYMRGYYPTSVPENVKSSQFATIQIADLAEDCAELAKILKKKFNIKQVFLVGHDWGAIAAYGAVNFQPEIYSKAAMMSVPPGGTFLRNLIMNPGQFARSWYILFFQLPILPENTIENTHGEFIRSL
ncbi:MAG: alpha/beta fold hydrolase, partial [Leptospiraceae bacterium]|nr:alpha/beta fold hydrolase [Leptospiraceae bacterium]